MIQRRTLLTKGSLMAAVPAVMGVMPRLLSAAPKNGSGQLNQAVLDAVTEYFSQVGVKAYNQQLTQGDINGAIIMARLLRKHFTDVGVDPTFQNLARNADPAGLTIATGSPVVTLTYGLFSKAGSSVTIAGVANTFSQIVSEAGLTVLAKEGITPSLERLEQHWTATVGKLPVSLDRRMGSAHLRRVDVCADFNFLASALGTAAAELALGCLPVDPAFVVICPAVGVLGVIAAVVGVVDWIAC